MKWTPYAGRNRYLVRSEHYGWIGGLSYSACARRVESRDEWIGWTEEARKRNHTFVINNSRYLIAPTVRVNVWHRMYWQNAKHVWLMMGKSV
ncbi:MAG: DUF4338 domain-containing protein [Planctomycetia bacterium]|nr:DUF4338 domain-containing protein [Planctomycetia bacterium]